MTRSSITTTTDATDSATRTSESRNGSVCPRPPDNVAPPSTRPRTHALPRPVTEPSSDKASANAMEIPAPGGDQLDPKQQCRPPGAVCCTKYRGTSGQLPPLQPETRCANRASPTPWQTAVQGWRPSRPSCLPEQVGQPATPAGGCRELPAGARGR